jgi:GAF domain-containing protein
MSGTGVPRPPCTAKTGYAMHIDSTTGVVQTAASVMPNTGVARPADAIEVATSPAALLAEISSLRARVAVLEQNLADARSLALAGEATELGRSLVYYVLDVLCALLHPQRGNTLVLDVLSDSIHEQVRDAQVIVGPMQMVLERPSLQRALAGEPTRLQTRYESALWLPIMHGAEVAVILCLRRAPTSPFSPEEQEIGELLGPLLISALQAGRRTFDLHHDPQALRSLALALAPCIRSGGGRVAAKGRDADRLAEELGLRKRARQPIQLGAILHDIGTVDLAEDLLTGPGALSARDFNQVRQHPLFGAEIVRHLPAMDDVVPCVRHHHEHWDGSGYPDGLKGEDIPIGARIVAVVDAFHAAISPRKGYEPRDVGAAMQDLTQRSGSIFDPQAVEAFVRLTASEQSGA